MCRQMLLETFLINMTYVAVFSLDSLEIALRKMTEIDRIIDWFHLQRNKQIKSLINVF